MASSSVDLPDPLGPIRLVACPACRAKDTSASTVWAPYATDTASARTVTGAASEGLRLELHDPYRLSN